MKSGTRFLITVVAVTFGVSLTLHAGSTLIPIKDIPNAINKLKTGTPAEKAKAAKDLGDRGQIRASDVKAAVEPLKKLLSDDSDAKVRAASAEALGKIAPEPKETVALLIKSLKEDKEADVKIAVMVSLGRFGMDAKSALPELRKYAQDKDKDKKKLANTAQMVIRNLSQKK
jgi:HEAT repeat protein